MSTTTSAIVRLQLRARQQLAAWTTGSRDRGDVPGWVMITIMTVAIVGLIWTFMGDSLVERFSTTVDGLTGPGDAPAGGN